MPNENQIIDEIIKEAQTNLKIPEDFIEWIPYEQFENIEKNWKNTCCAQKWYFFGAFRRVSPILRCYGLTKRSVSENTEEYMLVIQFAENKFKASDNILLSQNNQDIENQVVQNTSNGLHLNRQNNPYHSCRIDLSQISAVSQYH
ncbi:7476_t:CDS:2, partial [Dentiscutata erythropus]